MRRGNFEFVKKISKDYEGDIYIAITAAERNSRINYYEAGRNLRIVLEKYYKLLGAQGASTFDMEKYLRNNNKLTAAAMAKYDYTTAKGTTKKGNGYYLWRIFENHCLHDIDVPVMAVNYDNMVVVLEIIFEIFKEEAKKIKGKKFVQDIPDFDENIMPIGEQYILRSYVPTDSELTDCVREFETCSFLSGDKVEYYGIVRVINAKLKDELMLRDREVFNELSQNSLERFDGNVTINVLSKLNNQNSEFYIVNYKFNRPIIRLAEYLSGDISIEERIEICHKIAVIVQKFHKLDVPIYLRNLSFESVYLYKDAKDQFVVSIIKLDCAKILSQDYNTVLSKVQNINELEKYQKFTKYIANEIRTSNFDENEEYDWEKADIYSLGVLFGEILRGSVQVQRASTTKLRRTGLNPEIAGMIDGATADKSERISMEEIMKVFDK